VIFLDNIVSGQGGGLYTVYPNNLFLSFSIFQGNLADEGAGLYYILGGRFLEENTLRDLFTLEYCFFTRNEANYHSGGAYLNFKEIQKNQ
jgi:hypothetical protein